MGNPSPKHMLPKFALVSPMTFLVFSESAAEHKQYVDAVVSGFCQPKMTIQASNCVWGQTELPYRGHTICQDDFKLEPEKAAGKKRVGWLSFGYCFCLTLSARPASKPKSAPEVHCR